MLLARDQLTTATFLNWSARFAIRQKEVISENFPIMKSEVTRGRLRVNMYLKPKISLLNTQTEKPSQLISCLLFLGVRYSKKTNWSIVIFKEAFKPPFHGWRFHLQRRDIAWQSPERRLSNRKWREFRERFIEFQTDDRAKAGNLS